MPKRKKIHAYTQWAKSRLDEMDATLFVLEDKVDEMEVKTRTKAESALNNMRSWRDSFKARIDANIQEGKKAWDASKTELESDWKEFEEAVNARITAAKDYVHHNEATFKVRAEAQLKGWQSAIDELKKEAVKFKIDTNTEFENAIAEMKNKAKSVETKLNRLKKAESKTAAALNTALSESRIAFEKANKEAHKAFQKTLD